MKGWRTINANRHHFRDFLSAIQCRLFAIAIAWLSANSTAYAAGTTLIVETHDVATGYSWGFETGLKQHLGSFKDGRSIHAVSRYTRTNPAANLPPLGNPDFLVWVDENLGIALAVEHPADVFTEGVNPGGNLTFASEAPSGEEGRLWWVLGGRANELPFDLARSTELFDPNHFDVVADDFYTTGRSTAPTLSVVGGSGLLVFRYLHSTDPSDAVLFHRYDLESLPPVLETTKQLGHASSFAGLGDVTIEQVWSRWDPRRRALSVSWEWYASEMIGGETVRYFGSNPFIYTDDGGETWRLADGSIAALPLTYANTSDPRVAPFDHLGLRQSTKWYPRDSGFAPDGTPWLMLPVGSGARQFNFFFWGPSGWESRTLSTDVDEGDPIACGTTKNYVVCSYSEGQSPATLQFRFSGDGGRTWSTPAVIDVLDRAQDGSSQSIDWVSFAQPADNYADDAARFFVGYYKSADKSFGRRFKNNIRWVRVAIDAANSKPTVEIETPVDGSSYEVGVPIDLSATTSDPDGDTLTLSWTANGSGIVAPWTPAAGHYSVVATASDGNGGMAADSAAIEIIDPHALTVPETPSMSPASVKRTTATLSWSNVSGESSYEIGRWKYNSSNLVCRNLVIFKSVAADVTTTKNTINQGGSYCYAVRAVNAQGASKWSNKMTATLRP